MATISIIIPTLNEAECLAATLDALGRDHEIIVVDGDSKDATRSIAESRGATFLPAPSRGRASQMNYGAAASSGDLLLFLHADTIVPPTALENMRTALISNPNLIGGGFYRFFDSKSTFLKFTCRLANLRSKYWCLFLGDQAMFVRRNEYIKIGGFLESLPFGEDLDFSIRLNEKGNTVAIKSPVLTSARRFNRLGPVRQVFKDLFLAIQVARLRRQ